LDTQILYEPEFYHSSVSEDDEYIAHREELFYCQPPPDYCPFIVRYDIDQSTLHARAMTVSDVAAVLIQLTVSTAQVTYSEEGMPHAFIRIRPLNLAAAAAGFADEPINQDAFLKQTCEELASKLCRETFLGGIPGITKSQVRKDTLHYCDDSGAITSRSVTLIDAFGSNLRGILSLNEVQSELTTSNDVNDVLQTLGVEAATRVLFDQINDTIKCDGNYINERHVLLLTNLMTHLGYLLPVSRHGINRSSGFSVLAKSSFEETVDQLFEAAIYSEVDECRCVTSNIMLGRRAKVGTGICHIETEAITSIPEENEDSDDDVVFTSIDVDDTLVTSIRNDNVVPIETPYTDTISPFVGVSSIPSNTVQHSFLDAYPLPQTYEPTSPRRQRKRKYVPSSPRTNTGTS
jgi:DNA-directed RNA polymerase II subunit RPB1